MVAPLVLASAPRLEVLGAPGEQGIKSEAFVKRESGQQLCVAKTLLEHDLGGHLPGTGPLAILYGQGCRCEALRMFEL